MDDGAAALFEMFPDLPGQTLSSVWRNNGGDFSAAVDEALTISSLDNFNVEGQAQAQPPSEEPPPRDVRQELLEWENASSLLPAPTEETSSHAYPSASGLHEGAATRNGHGGQPMNEESSPSRFSRAASLENGLAQKLPWESTERYVIGSGELGLLNELQMPRRGSVVSLSPEFLRVPPPPPFLALTTAAAPEAAAADGFEEDNSQEAPPCVEPLIHLGGYKDDDNDSVEPVHLSPIVRPSDDDDDPAGARGGRAGGSEERVGWQHPLATPSSVMSSPVMPSSVKPSAKPSARPSIKPATAVFTPPRALPELSYGGAETKTPKNGRGTAWGAGDNDNDDDVGGWNKSEGGAQGFSRRRAERARRDLVRDPAAAVVGSADASGPPLLRGDQPRRKGPGAATESARNVETASAADRIAAYRPGTRFHVAVDKGAIGLGITVKDICGRFFVYRLQALADGSPGSAEEAGVKEGDELLGVEELDFESERWDMDQLVSYMAELMGVVILHLMRGDGPLPRAPTTDVENGMSHGVARIEEYGAAETWQQGRSDSVACGDGSGGGGGGGGRQSRAAERGPRRARRLLEVLEEEDLLKPSEAADTSTLYCQISDRARQWDSGELWLSVAGMAHRPSREVIAAMAHRWQPGEPMTWDESDSSGGEPSPGTPRGGRELGSAADSGHGVGIGAASAVEIAKTRGSYNGRGEHDDDDDDHPADLERIGTALLGHPLFCDPLSVVEKGAKPGVAASAGRRSRSPTHASGNQEVENGPCWSPWPQLVALESKAARRRTVVPTQGIRKALNVRVLEQVPPPPQAAAAASGKANGDAAPHSTVYVVWVMDVESGAEWKVHRCHAEFAELWEVCTGLRPSLARLDFPPWFPDMKETPGMVEARRPRLESYLQRLCSLLYMAPLHPSSAYVAHLLQDFLGTSPRVETLERLQKSRPERELRQALQVRAWQVLRLPPLERVVAEFVRDAFDANVSRGKKPVSAEAVLKRLPEVIEHLQYVVTEGCFEELRDMVRASAGSVPGSAKNPRGPGAVGRGTRDGGEGKSDHRPELDKLEEEDEALELISGSVRRQVEAEVFVPIMGRLYELLRTEGPTARLEKAVSLGVEEARGKPQSFHGIPISSISPSSWRSSVKLLRTAGSFTLPCDKLDALVAVAHDIPALYLAEHTGDNATNLGADDFLPIFIYVLVNAKVERLAAQSAVLEALCDPKKMMGEAGFCIATLSAALQHLGRDTESRPRRGGAIATLLGRRN